MKCKKLFGTCKPAASEERKYKTFDLETEPEETGELICIHKIAVYTT